jgi:hypothetical protein
MRRPGLRAAALACAAGFALFAACKSPDGADTTASQRRATGVTNAANPAAAPGAAPTPYTNRPAPPRVDAHGHTDTARRVTVGELQQLIAKGEAVAVDVRSPEAYRQARIKGAILMPSDEVKARARELPKDKLLVFYCA